MKLSNYIKFLISIGLSLFAGVVGSLFTMPAIDMWYNHLIKPALNPPSWVFAPVWTTLYILMGIAAYLVWTSNKHKKEIKLALLIFLIQLALNSIWSIIFFGLQDPLLALINIIILWIAILITIFIFYRISRVAAWLMIPYILWVSFAIYLNYSILVLNTIS